jgi:CRP/FNR family transcriptional regulator, cyclic AMP receptor protein
MSQQDFLRKMILFKSLDDAELVDILALCNTKRYAAKNQIFAEGDPASRLYLIRDGEVRISRMIPGAGEEALAVLKPGDFFGEMALIDESVRSAYAIANTDCTLMEIGIKELQDHLSKNERTAVKFLDAFCRILASRLRATNDRFYGLFAMTQFFK